MGCSLSPGKVTAQNAVGIFSIGFSVTVPCAGHRQHRPEQCCADRGQTESFGPWRPEQSEENTIIGTISDQLSKWKWPCTRQNVCQPVASTKESDSCNCSVCLRISSSASRPRAPRNQKRSHSFLSPRFASLKLVSFGSCSSNDCTWKRRKKKVTLEVSASRESGSALPASSHAETGLES